MFFFNKFVRHLNVHLNNIENEIFLLSVPLEPRYLGCICLGCSFLNVSVTSESGQSQIHNRFHYSNPYFTYLHSLLMAFHAVDSRLGLMSVL